MREFTHRAPVVTQGSVNPLHVQLRSQTPQAPVPPLDDDVVDPELDALEDVEPDELVPPLVEPELDEVVPLDDDDDVPPDDGAPVSGPSGRSKPLLPGDGIVELSSPPLAVGLEGASEPGAPLAHAAAARITQVTRSLMTPSYAIRGRHAMSARCGCSVRARRG